MAPEAVIAYATAIQGRSTEVRSVLLPALDAFSPIRTSSQTVLCNKVSGHEKTRALFRNLPARVDCGTRQNTLVRNRLAREKGEPWNPARNAAVPVTIH